ncbi:hypothetical protein ACROYT_G029585 [Oculina patagonica]
MLVTGSRLLVSFMEILLILASLSRFAAQEYDDWSTETPTSSSPNHKTSKHNDKAVTEKNFNDDDDFDFTEGSLLDGTSSPIMYAIMGGATVLGFIMFVYACYKCCIRDCRWQQAVNMATVALPPQVFGRDNPMMQLVNQQ